MVDERLAQVATQLANLPAGGGSESKTDMKQFEDYLLKEDSSAPDADTPAPSPPKTPAEPIEEPKPTETPVSDQEMADPIGDRINVIFGKRPAEGATESPDAKISNTGTPSTAEEDANAAPGPIVNNVVVVNDNNGVGMEVDDGDSGKLDDNGVQAEKDQPADDGAAGEQWPEQGDQPEAYPDLGFPMNPPSYPDHPEFHYRYRAGSNSTPQRRRIDFQRAIVLPSVKRDPYTGRVPQEEYDARENAEMMLSLGCVLSFSIVLGEIQ